MQSRRTVFLYVFRIWLLTIMGGAGLATVLMVVRSGERAMFSFIPMSMVAGFYSLPTFLLLSILFAFLPRWFPKDQTRRIWATVFATLAFVFTVLIFLRTSFLSDVVSSFDYNTQQLAVMVAFPLAAGAGAWLFFPNSINPLTGRRRNEDILDDTF